MVLKERSSVAESNWNLSEASGQTGEVTHFLSKALFPNHMTRLLGTLMLHQIFTGG